MDLESVVRLFHGSPYEFTHFNECKSGIHFGSLDKAIQAATLKLGRLSAREFEKLRVNQDNNPSKWLGKVYECHLRLGNTKRISDPRTPQAWSRQIKKAKDEGYTSIIYSNDYECQNKSDSLCLFSSRDILSVRLMSDAEIDSERQKDLEFDSLQERDPLTSISMSFDGLRCI